MDPSKWIPFDQLGDSTRDRITTIYPYLKLDLSVFQDKDSGVFMKQTNNVKIEKLLDPGSESKNKIVSASKGKK